MASILLRAALVGGLLSSSARAQSSDLPPQVLPSLQAPAGQDPRTGDGRSVDAIRLHLALGQFTEARQEAERFIRQYAVHHPTGTARVILRIGSSLADRESWKEARSWMESSMGMIDRSAPVAEQIEAHALLGRALAATGSVAGADREYEKVRQRAPKLAEIVGSMLAAGDDDRMALRGAMNAVGEAHFHFAEQRRMAVQAIAVPTYRGGASGKDVLRFVQTSLATWLTRRRKAVVEAEDAYLEVLRMEPAPPPRWVVAAGSRVARMWGDHLRAPRLARMPPMLAHDDELRTTFLSATAELMVVDRDRAKSAHETCLNFSVKYQQFDEHSRACEAWLERNHSRDYHRNDVLGLSPDRVTLGVPDRSSPLDRDGKQVATLPVWGRRSEAERPEETLEIVTLPRLRTR